MNHSVEGWEKSTAHRFKKGYGSQRSWKRKSETEGEQEFRYVIDNEDAEDIPFL